MVVSQYGIGIDASTGVERRFMTITSGMLSVNVALSNEDWAKLVQMAEARGSDRQHERRAAPAETRVRKRAEEPTEEQFDPPFEDY